MNTPTIPPSGGEHRFNFAAFCSLVRIELYAMRTATRIGTVEVIARRIMAICETSGVVCNEFARYDHGTPEDLVNRVWWLAKEYEYCAMAIKAQPERIEKMLSSPVIH